MFCVLHVLCVVCCVVCCVYKKHKWLISSPECGVPECPSCLPKLFLILFLRNDWSSPLLVTGIPVSWPHLVSPCFPHFNIHSVPVPAALWSHATDNAQCFNGFQMLFVGFINSLCFYLYLVLSYALFSIRVHQFDTLCCLQLKWRKPSPIKTTVGGDNLWTRIVAAAFSEYYAIVAFWKLWWQNWGTLL